MRPGDRAYRTLRTEILDGEARPGTVLQEVEQSTRLGVSRTPMREALRQLAADGLVGHPAAARSSWPSSATTSSRSTSCARRSRAKAAGLAAQRHEDAPFLAIRDRLREAPQLLAQGEEGLVACFAIVDDLDDAIEALVANPFLATALPQRAASLGLSAGSPGTTPSGCAPPRASTSSSSTRSSPATRSSPPTPRMWHLHMSLTNALATSAEPRRAEGPNVQMHHVRVHRGDENLARDGQLAWKIAEVAADSVDVTDEVAEMVVNRVIDNASVAAPRSRAARHRRAQPGARPSRIGAATARPCSASTARRTSPEWAAWANSVAVRDSTFTTRSSPPSTRTRATTSRRSSPSPNLAAAAARQSRARSRHRHRVRDPGRPREGDLPAHKIDHVAHLGPSAAAGIGTLLGLDPTTIFQPSARRAHDHRDPPVPQGARISTWKAHAPAFASKMAVEAVDRAMRGESSPTPIYEGEDGVIAWLLDGPDAAYDMPLPERRGQALHPRQLHEDTRVVPGAGLDRPPRASSKAEHPGDSDSIHSASRAHHIRHHTHYVIGSGANDPQKYDRRASRETLDHDPVHLHRGTSGRRVASCPLLRPRARGPPRRRGSTVEKVVTVEDAEWTRRYPRSTSPRRRSAALVVITLTDGTASLKKSLSPMRTRSVRPFASRAVRQEVP